MPAKNSLNLIDASVGSYKINAECYRGQEFCVALEIYQGYDVFLIKVRFNELLRRPFFLSRSIALLSNRGATTKNATNSRKVKNFTTKKDFQNIFTYRDGV